MRLETGVERWLWYSVRRRLLDADLEDFREDMRGRVLEIGGGRVGRRGYFRPPEENVEMWTYLDMDDKRMPHIRADVENLCFRTSTFDTIVCLEVLEYVTHPQVAMDEMYRILRNGGVLILASPFLHRVDDSHDYWRFTEHGVKRLLSNSGFEICSIRRQGAALSVVVNVLKYAIYVTPSRWLRSLLGLIAYVPLESLLALDRLIAKQRPVLRTFSTGYLVGAVRPWHADKNQWQLARKTGERDKRKATGS